MRRKISKSQLKKIIFIIGTVLCLAPTFLFVLVHQQVLGPLPDLRALQAIDQHEASIIYSADEAVLGKYYLENRTETLLENISPVTIDALVATEDVRFYQHEGIDYRSLLRVAVKTILLQDASSGGGSTLTMQLAKNLYPRKRFWLFSLPINKIRETIIATRLEKIYSKEEILEMYFNTVSFGGDVYGIEVAARRFFNVSAAQLDTVQAATLVGMLKATTTYNPRLYPERAKNRRNLVVSQLVNYKPEKASRKEFLQQQPLALNYTYENVRKGNAAYFRENLRQQLGKLLEPYKKEDGSAYNIYTDGLKIYTSIDSRVQRMAEQAVQDKMKELQALFNRHWKGREKPWENKNYLLRQLHRSSVYPQLVQAAGNRDAADKLASQPVPMKVFSWDGEQEKEMSYLDSIAWYRNFLNAGVLAIEPRTGLVRAWVGGIDHRYFKYDHVKAQRQVGSTFKPVVYATALELGKDPCEFVSNEQVRYANYDNWKPQNANNQYDGYYSLKGGLTHSVNTVSVKLLMESGINEVRETAALLGISNVPEAPSIALGAAEISLLEMVAAYNTFSNRGVYVAPVTIRKVEDKSGNLIADFTEKQRIERVMEKETADMMIDMLKSVVDSGSARALRYRYGLRNDIAGKTGTTQLQADGWFIGMMPGLTIGVWVGGADRNVRFRSLSLGQGARTALPVWAGMVKQLNNEPAFRKVMYREYPPLPGYIRAKMDCELYKSDLAEEKGFFQKLFTRKKDTVRQKKPTQRPRSPVRRPKAKKKPFLERVLKIFKKNRDKD